MRQAWFITARAGIPLFSREPLGVPGMEFMYLPLCVCVQTNLCVRVCAFVRVAIAVSGKFGAQVTFWPVVMRVMHSTRFPASKSRARHSKMNQRKALGGNSSANRTEQCRASQKIEKNESVHSATPARQLLFEAFDVVPSY